MIITTRQIPSGGGRKFYSSKTLILILALLLHAGKSVYAQIAQTFTYTGAMQSFVAPSNGTYQLETWGAQGGANWVNNTNFGGYAKAIYSFTAGTVLNIYVGQQPATITGGFNGGGNGEGAGIGGGGASDVRLNGTALANRIVVAGGGGGAGYWSSLHVVGGVGGGLTGGDGYRNTTADPGGQGGTQSGSGNGTCVSFGNPAMAGGLGFGGSPSGCGCEGYGGGGGYYGGAGSGNCRGGGGGSGFISSAGTSTVFASGIRVGHGQVVITLLFSTTSTQSNVSCNGGANGSATISAVGAAGPFTYSWIPSGGTSSVATNLAAGAYTCVVTTPGSTILPVVTITQPSALTSSVVSQTSVTCNGGNNGSASLTAIGGVAPYTYTWSPTGGNAGSASSLVAGNYTISIKDANNCAVLNQVSIIQPASFSVTPSATSPSICNGGSTTLNGSGAANYAWTGTVTNGISFSPTITTTYSLTGTNAIGCPASNTAVITVTVHNIPVIAVNSGSICLGKSFTLTASGAGTYTYTGGSNIVSPTANTSYSVTGTSTAGCISSSPAVSTISVVALPTLAVNSGSICSGESFTLVPSGASTYTFSGSNATVSPAITTTYAVTGTSTSGCVSSNTAISTVTVYALPVLAVNSGSICDGTTFTINPSGAITYTFSGGTSAVAPSVTTSYSVTGTSNDGCISSPVISTVTVIALPVISVNSGTICSGDSFTLTASGASTYTFSSGSSVVSPTLTTTYSVSGSSPEGCVSASPGMPSVTVNALPVISITGPGSICNGNNAVFMASGAATYSWSTAANTSSIFVSPSSSISYSVTGTNPDGCKGIASHSLTVNPLPVLTTVNSSSLICPGESASIAVSGALFYSWGSGETTTVIIVSPVNTSTYSVTGTDLNGCVNSAVATQSVGDCSGITKIRGNMATLLIYPNPNNGEFTITSQEESALSVMNEIGQIIARIELKAALLHQVSLQNLPAGIYFLNGTSGEQVIHQKIIISR